MTPDVQAIQGILKQLEKAWNSGDSEAFAAPFAVDANFIHIFGGQLDGRESIEASHRQIFDSIYRGSTAEFKLRNVRFVGPDVAIVFCFAHLKFGQGSGTQEIDTRPTFTMTREHGSWQIVAFQNTRVSDLPPSDFSRL
jgi:uncharacterized protein (TIGR02246 family)